MMKRIPGTNKVIFVPEHAGDVVFDYSNVADADNSIKQEDVVVLGDWEDYTGSAVVSNGQVRNAGVADELQWDVIAKAEGAEFTGVTDRGKHKQTHRSRNKLITIEP